MEFEIAKRQLLDELTAWQGVELFLRGAGRLPVKNTDIITPTILQGYLDWASEQTLLSEIHLDIYYKVQKCLDKIEPHTPPEEAK